MSDLKERIMKGMRIVQIVSLFILCGCMTVSAAGTEKKKAKKFNAVKQAAKQVITGGTWIKDEQGIHYRIMPNEKNPGGKLLADTWVTIDDCIYCFDAKGSLRFGHFKYKGKIYAADKETGEIYHGQRFSDNGMTYAAGRDGVLIMSKWMSIGGDKYYFDAKGRMVTSRWVGEYYVGSMGNRISGLKKKTLTKAASKYENTNKCRLIIVGASRVDQMREAVGTASRFSFNKTTWNTVFLAVGGKGYDWLIKKADPKLCAYLDMYPNSKVVFQMGNNNLGGAGEGLINEYIAYYKQLESHYPKASFYYMDTLPGASEEMNTRRVAFNEKLKEAFPNQYIGGYDFMMELPYKPIGDGNHYRPSTSRAIFRYIRKKVGLL